MSFNKYEFLDDLKGNIHFAHEEGYLNDLSDFVREEVDNAVIYYSTSLEIMKEFRVYDWEDYQSEFGPINNVSQLAYLVLLDYVYEELDFEQIESDLEELEEE